MITHLFFSGSHLWGFYNFGVIRYIQAFPQKFKLLKNYGGVSFGACVAFLLSINLKIEEIENIFYEFSKDEDIKSVYFNDMFNIIDNKGIDNTSKYFKWITDYLTKINMMLMNLHLWIYPKNLVIIYISLVYLLILD